MGDSEPKLKWYQFRLRSLFLLFALVALLLGLVMSPLPTRIAEEFDPVPDGMVAFSWMAVPSPDSDEGDCVIRARWYAETPFDMQICREAIRSNDDGASSEQNVGSMTRSRSQLIGHNALLEYEFAASENRLKVVDITDGDRQVVGESILPKTGCLRWLGIPFAQLPRSRWLRSGRTGRFGGMHFLECKVSTQPGDIRAESFYWKSWFVETAK